MPADKSRFLGFFIGTTIVVAGGIGAYVFIKGFLGGGDSNSPLSSAKVVPAQALLATYINTDPRSWSQLQHFGTPKAQQILAKGLQDIDQDMNKELFNGANISYEKDIRPWVGGIMIALLPPNPTKAVQSTTPKTQPDLGILMVVGIKDKLSALNFANKLKSQKSLQTQESDYKGEKIIETQEKGKSTYTSVLDNTYVLLAPDKQAIENAISTYKGDPSFASKENATNLLSKSIDTKSSVAQIYVPDYAGMIQQLASYNLQSNQIPPQTLQQLKQIKSLVASVGIDDQGVRFKATINTDPQTNKFQYELTPGKILSQFPAETFALINGQGIKHSWQSLVEQSKDYPEFQQAVTQIRGQLNTINLDLDKDIIGWMDGEFAMGAVESNQGLLAKVGFGGALVLGTSDRPTAEATLTKLDGIAKQQSLIVSTRNIDGKNVTEWQIPQQGTLIAHGWLDQNTLFLAIGGPVAEALTQHKGQSIDNTENFKAVTGSLPKPNGGYFYINMEKANVLMNRFPALSQSRTPETSALLESIRGLGVAVNSPDKSTNQMEMLLALKPSK